MSELVKLHPLMVNAVAPEPPAEALQVDIRPATGADIPWIYSSWTKNYREKGALMSAIDGRVYYDQHRKRIERIISSAGTATIVACSAENNEQILGWLCGTRNLPPYDVVWHYGHVKSHMRRHGIMRALVTAFGVTKDSNCCHTHMMAVGWRQTNSHHDAPLMLPAILPSHWYYNPYLLEA